MFISAAASAQIPYNGLSGAAPTGPSRLPWGAGSGRYGAAQAFFAVAVRWLRVRRGWMSRWPTRDWDAHAVGSSVEPAGRDCATCIRTDGTSADVVHDAGCTADAPPPHASAIPDTGWVASATQPVTPNARIPARGDVVHCALSAIPSAVGPSISIPHSQQVAGRLPQRAPAGNGLVVRPQIEGDCVVRQAEQRDGQPRSTSNQHICHTVENGGASCYGLRCLVAHSSKGAELCIFTSSGTQIVERGEAPYK